MAPRLGMVRRIADELLTLKMLDIRQLSAEELSLATTTFERLRLMTRDETRRRRLLAWQGKLELRNAAEHCDDC